MNYMQKYRLGNKFTRMAYWVQTHRRADIISCMSPIRLDMSLNPDTSLWVLGFL